MSIIDLQFIKFLSYFAIKQLKSREIETEKTVLLKNPWFDFQDENY
jgi:hypothetical protein